MSNCNCNCNDCKCEHKHTCSCKARRYAGQIKQVEPTCPPTAIIPLVVVDDVSNLKALSACFAHVSNINTTFYIDDKSRLAITWAGPVEQDDYDYEANPLNLRSQTLYDFKNNRAYYYNKLGKYKVIEILED